MDHHLKNHDWREEADLLHSELRILDWILYQVCSNEIKRGNNLNILVRRDEQ